MENYDILTQKITAIDDNILKATEEFAKDMCTRENKRKELSTSQIRRFYGEVKRLQLNGYDPAGVKMLKPKLAYAAGRSGENDKIRMFYKILSKAIDKIDDEDSFNNFVKMFEAIVAYHKLYNKNYPQLKK